MKMRHKNAIQIVYMYVYGVMCWVVTCRIEKPTINRNQSHNGSAENKNRSL